MACTTVVNEQQWPNDATGYVCCTVHQLLDEDSLVHERLRSDGNCSTRDGALTQDITIRTLAWKQNSGGSHDPEALTQATSVRWKLMSALCPNVRRPTHSSDFP